MHRVSTAVPQSSGVRCAPTARPVSGLPPSLGSSAYCTSTPAVPFLARGATHSSQRRRPHTHFVTKTYASSRLEALRTKLTALRRADTGWGACRTDPCCRSGKEQRSKAWPSTSSQRSWARRWKKRARSPPTLARILLNPCQLSEQPSSADTFQTSSYRTEELGPGTCSSGIGSD